MGNYGSSCGYQQYRTEEGCGCERISSFPDCTPPAMAYVPFQQWCDVYAMDKAMCQGTLFPVLDKPFIGGRYKW